jgi:release factor glutamine methyltransferase
VLAVGVAVAAAVPGISLSAVDVEPSAVRCARRNLVTGTVYEGDLYEPLPSELKGRVDVLVANAPYVPTGAVGLMPPEARLHEPLVALDGGGDGLDVLRRVVAAAPVWLTPHGHVLFETGVPQLPAATAAVTAAGLTPEVRMDDEIGATVVIGTVIGTR